MSVRVHVAREHQTDRDRGGAPGWPARFWALVQRPPLIAGAVLSLALLYSFPWLRIPDVAGVPLPFQRLIAWFGLGVLMVTLCVRGRFRANAAARFYLGIAALFFAVLGVSSFVNIASNEVFHTVRFLSELSKYVAVFGTGFLVYYALEHGLVKTAWLERLLLVSGAVSILLAYLFLFLYWGGFRSTNEVLTNSFGGALGVWPTASFLPRLAGTTAEPQQLSVVFNTAIMLMLSRRYIHRFWPVALLGLFALVLSQSKFALISLFAIAVFVDAVYKRHRFVFGALLILMIPPGLGFLSTLPVFRTTLNQGLEAQAFTDRIENLGILGSIIESNLLEGIGVGQYGVYRGALLFGDPFDNPNYNAGNDLITIFAETGVFGFLLVALLFGVLFSKFLGVLPRLRGPRFESYLALLIGAVTIFLNMFIGYEFLHAFFWVNLGMLLYLYRVWGLYAPAPQAAATPTPDSSTP